MKGSTMYRRILVVVVVLVSAMFAALTHGQLVHAGGNSNPGIFPPGSNPFGATYGVWSARWWQWGLSFPDGNTNPMVDPTGAACANGQTGQVWFLAGKWNGGTVTRLCTVPAGKALFFPLVNAVDIHVPGDGLDTPELLRQDLLSFFGPITELHASIDGVPVNNLNPQATPYRACAGGDPACAPAFSVTLPEGNLFSAFGIGAGVYPAVADGYYLMLAPLSPGSHTIKFGGAGNGSSQDITYHLTVGSSSP